MKSERTKSIMEIIYYNSREAPVNLVGIANELGLSIRGADLSAEVVATIRKDNLIGGSSGYVILINQKLLHIKQRYTLALAISHFVMNKYFFHNELQINPHFRTGLPDNMEKKALAMANTLLMPQDLVIKLKDKYQGDIESMADALEVTHFRLTKILESIDARLGNNKKTEK